MFNVRINLSNPDYRAATPSPLPSHHLLTLLSMSHVPPRKKHTVRRKGRGKEKVENMTSSWRTS
jgi:hypothetical protein